MIHPSASKSPASGPNEDQSPVVNLDSRLGSEDTPEKPSTDFDGLYEALKNLWESNTNFGNKDVIGCLNNYTSADGSTPYKSTQSQVSTIAQVMKRLKEEGGEDSIVYTKLNQSLGYAVASNGVLVDFISKMLLRSDPPEPW